MTTTIDNLQLNTLIMEIHEPSAPITNAAETVVAETVVAETAAAETVVSETVAAETVAETVVAETVVETAAETAAETVVETAAETVAAETVVEPLTPKQKVEQNIKRKLKELINVEEVINELLTNPTLLGKRKWLNRDEIADVLQLNINESKYHFLNTKILDMYNNGMKDEYLETTDKYMMECVADYLSKMENIHKKRIDYYIRSIKASKLPEDEEYINENYSQLARIVSDEYNNYELCVKINVICNRLFSVVSEWMYDRIPHSLLNKKLVFISVINDFLSKTDDDLCNFRTNKIDLKIQFSQCKLPKEDIDEFMNLWDEMGMPREYIKESIATKILAGKLALNTSKTLDCPVCKELEVNCVPINWVCGHYICVDCHNDIVEQKKCPICRFEFNL